MLAKKPRNRQSVTRWRCGHDSDESGQLPGLPVARLSPPEKLQAPSPAWRDREAVAVTRPRFSPLKGYAPVARSESAQGCGSPLPTRH